MQESRVTDPETPTEGRRATSADVARASGVSRATVSYVLNDVPGKSISAATRTLVLETAQRLGHIPYAPARSLRLGRSNIVLALVRDFAIGYVANNVLRRLDLALAEHGYVLLAHRYDGDLRPMTELWGLVSPALVVAMGGLALPDEEAIGLARTKVVRAHNLMDNERIGRMQAAHLASRGHRRLGYAFPADPAVELIARERLTGVRAGCEELGLPEPSVQVVDTARPETIYAALDAWAHEDAAVSAVCAHNDEIAILLTAALTKRGLQVGRDLALIGVDDIPAARISMTTVRIDAVGWAQAVAEEVLAQLGDRPIVRDAEDFLELIVRDSA
jgi:DNA-binding LacI/PurR family transcriptional regulator